MRTPSTVRAHRRQTGFTYMLEYILRSYIITLEYILRVCVLLAINTAGLAYFGAAAVPPAALCSWLSCCSSIAHL